MRRKRNFSHIILFYFLLDAEAAAAAALADTSAAKVKVGEHLIEHILLNFSRNDFN